MMRTLRRGQTGDDVAAWEAFLRGTEDESVIVDGTFDATTEAATKLFQRKMGLTPDGVAGPKTLGMAMTLGFDPTSDISDDEGGPNWPERPLDAVSMSVADRMKTFGTFAYKADPTPANPENILITDGWAAKNVITVHVPQLEKMPGTSLKTGHLGMVQVHKLLANQLISVFQAWDDAGLVPLIKNWGGSWAPRFIRGSRTTLSNHAWATAFDINTVWNPLGARPALKGQLGSVRELVQIAHEHGWFWGGWFPTRQDGMHFECFRVL